MRAWRCQPAADSKPKLTREIALESARAIVAVQQRHLCPDGPDQSLGGQLLNGRLVMGNQARHTSLGYLGRIGRIDDVDEEIALLDAHHCTVGWPDKSLSGQIRDAARLMGKDSGCERMPGPVDRGEDQRLASRDSLKVADSTEIDAEK